MRLEIARSIEQVCQVAYQPDLLTVDKRRLYPNLDEVAAEMRRYYS